MVLSDVCLTSVCLSCRP